MKNSAFLQVLSAMFRHACRWSLVSVSLVLMATAPARAQVKLNAAAVPSSGQPGVQLIKVTGSGFPSGTIPAGNVTVSLIPAVANSGPSGTTNATAVTLFFGSFRAVSFQIPSTLATQSPTVYNVSISGSTSGGVAFTSSNSSSLTIDPPASVALSPASANRADAVTVQIAGSYTNFLQGATQANFGPGISVGGAPEGAFGPLTVTSPTAASASLAISPSADGGPVTVTVATGVQTATANFTILIPSIFKIQSWQTGPNGNPAAPSGKCLDYGSSPLGNGATVFLNDCSVAHPIHVFELPESYFADIQQTCAYEDTQIPPNCFHHEVLLFAGNAVIGVGNASQGITSSASSTSGTSIASQLTITQGGAPQYATEYQLSLQTPILSPYCFISIAAHCDPITQIFRLDGDSIILEGTPASNGLPALRIPCLNTDTALCPPPPPQLVIQVQNAQGMNGSPLVAAVRNLADNEFWDFLPQPGSSAYPTSGFMPVSTSFNLWNTYCSSPQASARSIPATACMVQNPSLVWGSVIDIFAIPNNDCLEEEQVSPFDSIDIGRCIDLSKYPPIFVPAGVTIRGNRRGTNFGPQLYKSDPSYALIFDVSGDYARVSGLRLRGPSRSTYYPQPTAMAIQVDFPGSGSPYGPLPFSPTTLTQFIATIDHNEVSDWPTSAIDARSAFDITQEGDPALCTYPGYFDIKRSTTYKCGEENPGAVYNPGVPDPANPDGPRMPIADDASTLANLHIARNFIHHNQQDNLGYGTGGRAFIQGNVFDWNRHAIASDGEPHQEYRAAYNLVLSGSSFGDQDFDMHGSNHGYSGTGGYYVDIVGNTFLDTNRPNYWLRGFPSYKTDFHGNVSARSDGDAVQLHLCFLICTGFDGNRSDFINVFSDNQFADSSPPYTDPTSTLGVGDFDGDGADDLFLATGAAWYYSPGGQREWRYLNPAHDTIDQLLFGDFDGDGRTDVVGMRPGQLFVSWGGISAFEPLNSNLPSGCTIPTMAVGDFNGVGRKTDIFCAAWQDQIKTYIWWISYGGKSSFMPVNSSAIPPQDLRFGHFAVCGMGTETDVFSVQGSGWYVSCGAATLWQLLGAALANTANGLVVADFNGDGNADIGMPCTAGGIFGTGIGASPGWQISDGGTHSWSACHTFSSSFSVANGAVGRFSGGPGADILLWNYYNSQRSANLWDFPGGAGTPYQLSAPDVDMH